MLMTKECKPAIRTLRGWAISVCRRRAPSANASNTAGCRTAPIRMPASAPSPKPAGIHRVSPEEAVAAVGDVLNSIGDTCPECPPDYASDHGSSTEVHQLPRNTPDPTRPFIAIS
jgi:hypothetical protein